MISFELCALIILLIIFLRRLQNRNFSTKISKFRTVGILEGALILLRKRSPAELFNLGHEWLQRYGCFAFGTGFDTYVCTGRREDVQVFFKMVDKGSTYHFFKPAMGDGILTSSGRRWKKMRTILEPAYGAKELSTNFIRIFNEHSRQFIEEIQKKGLGVTHNFRPLIFQVSARMNSETIIGSSDLQNAYGPPAKRIEQILMKRLYTPWLYPDFMYNLYLFFTEQKEELDAIRKHFFKTLQQHKHRALKNDSETSTKPRTIILDYLLKNDLTDEESTDEIMSLMTAGTETVGTSISFTLLMLAMNPEIQNKVLEELNQVFPDDKDRNIEISDLHKLRFLDKCLKESLRKLSIIPFIERRVTSEVTLGDGRVIPVGASLALSIYHIHNNPEYYPNPEVWNPHNFDEDAIAKRPGNTFIPFAVGMRQCIGNKSAMMSIKIFVARIIRNFKVTTSQREAKLVHYLAVRCISGYHLKFEKRQNWSTQNTIPPYVTCD